MKKTFFLLLTILCTTTWAQTEHVANGGFETNTGMPGNFEQIYLAPPWSIIPGSYADYYHENGTPPFDIPPSIGNLDQNISSLSNGSAIAGSKFSHVDFNDENPAPDLLYRGFIQQELATPLIGGNTYYGEIWVVLRNEADHAISNIGMHFSAQLLDQTESSGELIETLVVDPQIEANSIITDTENWTRISGCFEATEDYNYLTIGNFRVPENMSWIENEPVESTNNTHDSYYYIDNVSVKNFMPELTDFSICSGESVELGIADAAIEGATYSWAPTTGLSNPNSINPIANPTESTTYTLTVSYTNGSSCSTTQSVVVADNTDFTVNTQELSNLCGGNDYIDLNQYIDNPNGLTLSFEGATTEGIFNSNVDAGSYPISITAANSLGCQSTINFNIELVYCCSTEEEDAWILAAGTTQADLIALNGGSNTIENQTIYLSGNLILNGGADIFFNSCTLNIAPEANININNNTTVTFMQSLLQACDDVMWNGINVGKGNIHISLSTIKEAVKAVEMQNNHPVHYQIKQSYFIDNWIALDINSTTDPTSLFYGNTVRSNGNLLAPYSGLFSRAGIIIKNNHDLNDMNNVLTFGTTDVADFYNLFEQLQYGIRGQNSSFNVYNNKFRGILNLNNDYSVNIPSACIYVFDSNNNTNNPNINAEDDFIRVGGVSGGSNLFEKFERGVQSHRLQSTQIVGNTFRGSTQTGVYIAKHPYLGLNTSVNFNNFSSVNFPITSHRNESAQIIGNTISHAEFGIQGNGFNNETEELHIYENCLDNVIEGIGISNMDLVFVQSNQLNQVAATGIRSDNSLADVRGNHINGDGNEGSMGIITTQSRTQYNEQGSITMPSSTVGNYVQGFDELIRFNMNCDEHLLVGNELYNGNMGIVLNNNGIVGPQYFLNDLNIEIPSDNYWDPSIFGADQNPQLYTMGNTDGNLSPFFMRNWPGFNVTYSGWENISTNFAIPVFVIGSNFNPVDWSPWWLDCGYELADFEPNLPIAPPNNLNTQEQISQQSSEGFDAGIYLNKLHLYSQLNAQMLSNSDILQNFADSLLQTQGGNLAQMHRYISNGQLTAAHNYLTELMPDNSVLSTSINLWDVILPKMLQSEQWADSIIAAEHAQLQSIAYQCPFTHGTDVFTARNICRMLDTAWTDYSNPCEQSHTALARQAQQKDKLEQDWSFYPNPADDFLKIEGMQGDLRITDLMGKTVLQQTLQTGKTEVDISALNAGVYLLHLTNSKQNTNLAEKLIISR